MRCRLVAFGVLWALPSLGASAHVENRCPSLTAEAYDELDARVLLLLEGQGGSWPLPSVVCSEQGVWVEWRGARFDLPGRAPIPDEAVDVIEAQLQTPQPDVANVEAGAEQVVRPAKPAAPSHGRGVALSFETELPSASIATAIGPTFDFGTSLGPVTLSLREAFRFTVAGRQVSFMDLEAGVAYGAPFNPELPWGAVARVGAEGLVAYPGGGSARLAIVPVADLGLRLAHNFGVVALWLGVNGRARIVPLRLRLQHETIAARDLSATFSVGLAFVDWIRK